MGERKVYGYIRVSTRDQNEDRQMIAMKEAGVSPQNIFMDKQSGKDFNRLEYQKMLKKIKKTICSVLRVSIVWGAIMKKYWRSGGI